MTGSSVVRQSKTILAAFMTLELIRDFHCALREAVDAMLTE